MQSPKFTYPFVGVGILITIVATQTKDANIAAMTSFNIFLSPTFVTSFSQPQKAPFCFSVFLSLSVFTAVSGTQSFFAMETAVPGSLADSSKPQA